MDWLLLGGAIALIGIAVWLWLSVRRRLTGLALRGRPEHCPTCGRVMDPSWGGVCQFCAAVPVTPGPLTVPGPPPGIPTAIPTPPTWREAERIPTTTVEAPAPAVGVGVGVAPTPPAVTEKLVREPGAMA